MIDEDLAQFLCISKTGLLKHDFKISYLVIHQQYSFQILLQKRIIKFCCHDLLSEMNEKPLSSKILPFHKFWKSIRKEEMLLYIILKLKAFLYLKKSFGFIETFAWQKKKPQLSLRLLDLSLHILYEIYFKIEWNFNKIWCEENCQRVIS